MQPSLATSRSDSYSTYLESVELDIPSPPEPCRWNQGHCPSLEFEAQHSESRPTTVGVSCWPSCNKRPATANRRGKRARRGGQSRIPSRRTTHDRWTEVAVQTEHDENTVLQVGPSLFFPSQPTNQCAHAPLVRCSCLAVACQRQHPAIWVHITITIVERYVANRDNAMQ